MLDIHFLTLQSILLRYKRMKGFNVLNPMGWDAFGLPAERAAIRENRHPTEITKENIANFKNQLSSWVLLLIGTEKSVHLLLTITSGHSGYSCNCTRRDWAYLAEVPVNWCPAQGTVLANEEVVDGKYVETGEPVERRMMKQWMLKITAYAQRLLDDLDTLD